MKRTYRKRKSNSTSASGTLSGTGSTGNASASGRQPKQYIVERILDRRQRNGVTEYLLKWHGYSNSHNSWEPEENILSQKMIDDFNERYDQQTLDQQIYEQESSISGDHADEDSNSISRHLLLGVSARSNHSSHGSSSSSSSLNDTFGQIQSINRSLSFTNDVHRLASGRPSTLINKEKESYTPFLSPKSTKLELEQIKHNIANVSRSALRCNSLGSRARAHSTSSVGLIGKDRIKLTASTSPPQWMTHSAVKGQLHSKQKSSQLDHQSPMNSQGLINGDTSDEESAINLGGRRRTTCVDLNLPVEKIYGATQNSAGELFYLVKWKNCSGTELVHSGLMEDRQPRAVLDFFRSHCRFN